MIGAIYDKINEAVTGKKRKRSASRKEKVKKRKKLKSKSENITSTGSARNSNMNNKKKKRKVTRTKKKLIFKKRKKAKNVVSESDGNKENENSQNSSSNRGIDSTSATSVEEEEVGYDENKKIEIESNVQNFGEEIAESTIDETNIEINTDPDLKLTLKILKQLEGGNMMSTDPSEEATQIQQESSIISPKRIRKPKAIENPRKITISSILKDLETVDKYQFKEFTENFLPMKKHREQIYELEQELKEKIPTGFIDRIEGKLLSPSPEKKKEEDEKNQMLPNKEIEVKFLVEKVECKLIVKIEKQKENKKMYDVQVTAFVGKKTDQEEFVLEEPENTEIPIEFTNDELFYFPSFNKKFWKSLNMKSNKMRKAYKLLLSFIGTHFKQL